MKVTAQRRTASTTSAIDFRLVEMPALVPIWGSTVPRTFRNERYEVWRRSRSLRRR